MRLCMFHPRDHPMERGWVGRIENDHVIHLAAQTLQAYFTGGGSAREHAAYPLEGVQLLAPVLHPPSVRVFDTQTAFEFSNPAAVVGPDAEIRRREDLLLIPRIAAVLGADGEIGGFTLAADWRLSGEPEPKDRDFALGLGPAVVTADEFDPDVELTVRLGGEERRVSSPRFDWALACAFAAEGTRLYAGDVLASPAAHQPIRPGDATDVELETSSTGTLRLRLVGER